VATANSVDEALAKMGRFHSDVVICDIGMPVRDGISMAREVRRRERDSGGLVRTPLIALTAYGRVDDKIRILNAGFDSHVVSTAPPPLAHMPQPLQAGFPRGSQDTTPAPARYHDRDDLFNATLAAAHPRDVLGDSCAAVGRRPCP
jgi:CheY-like chemotaxis protein